MRIVEVMACNGEPICLTDHSVHTSISFVLTGLHRESGLPEDALAAARAARGIEGGPDSESALNGLVIDARQYPHRQGVQLEPSDVPRTESQENRSRRTFSRGSILNAPVFRPWELLFIIIIILFVFLVLAPSLNDIVLTFTLCKGNTFYVSQFTSVWS